MVDLHQLRVFVRAAEFGSFSRAAVALGIAQPSISRIIQDLERDWGGALFYRTGRGVALSELGEMALARARVLIRDASQLSEDLRAHGKQPSGTVAFGIPPSLIPAILPKLVNALRSEAPGIRLTIHEGFSDQIERWRSTGEIEIGIYSRFCEAEVVTDPEALFSSRLVLAAPRNAPALAATTPFADLGRYPLVLPSPPNGLRMLVQTAARRLGVSLDVAIEADSTLAQRQLCENCGLYMINAPETISDAEDPGAYRTSDIVAPVLHRYVVLVSTCQRPLSNAAREVATLVTKLLRKLPE